MEGSWWCCEGWYKVPIARESTSPNTVIAFMTVTKNLFTKKIR